MLKIFSETKMYSLYSKKAEFPGYKWLLTAKCGDTSLQVKLGWLGQIGFFTKIIEFKESRSAFNLALYHCRWGHLDRLDFTWWPWDEIGSRFHQSSYFTTCVQVTWSNYLHIPPHNLCRSSDLGKPWLWRASLSVFCSCFPLESRDACSGTWRLKEL